MGLYVFVNWQKSYNRIDTISTRMGMNERL